MLPIVDLVLSLLFLRRRRRKYQATFITNEKIIPVRSLHEAGSPPGWKLPGCRGQRRLPQAIGSTR